MMKKVHDAIYKVTAVGTAIGVFGFFLAVGPFQQVLPVWLLQLFMLPLLIQHAVAIVSDAFKTDSSPTSSPNPSPRSP